MLNRIAMMVAVICLAGTAQTTSTAIPGTVVDTSGATISGADIFITNTGTNQSRSVKTNEAGYFNAPALDPGTYSVAAAREGFRRQVRTGLELQVNQRLTLDFALTVGAVTETVSVVGSTPIIDPASSASGTVINERRIVDIPLNGRNYAQLAWMVPGVTPGQRHSNDTVNFSNLTRSPPTGSGSSTRSLRLTAPVATRYS